MQPSSHTLDRLGVEFDDPHLVANAGLLLPATLAQHLGLREVVEQHLDLGDAPGRANVGPKAMSLIHSMLAGGDSIDDTTVLRAGATQGVLGHAVLAPSTLGTFLRSFTVGHVRQLDAVGREMLRRAWEGERGPGARALTIDMDSTICEVFGLLKQGVGFGYTKVRGYHPLLATRADTGEVLHSRLRGGAAFTARGAAGFLAETFSRVRAAGATGQLTLRADSGFYSNAVLTTAAGRGCGSRSPRAWTRRSKGLLRPFPIRRGCRFRTGRARAPSARTSRDSPSPAPMLPRCPTPPSARRGCDSA